MSNGVGLRPVVINADSTLQIKVIYPLGECLRHHNNLSLNIHSLIGVYIFRLDHQSMIDINQLARCGACNRSRNETLSDLITLSVNRSAGCFRHNSPAGENNFLEISIQMASAVAYCLQSPPRHIHCEELRCKIESARGCVAALHLIRCDEIEIIFQLRTSNRIDVAELRCPYC